jgi:N-methylhydantoinase A
MAAAGALIGVDVGGTHTDVCVAAGGRLVRGKALTTHDDYSRGVIDAVAVAAGELSRSVELLLSEAEALVAGTTVVTNALTELRGAQVGVLITRGFRDTLRFAGGARRPVYDDQLQVSPPDIAPRRCILEIDERISREGTALLALREDQVRVAVRALRDDLGVETIAVCFLWSFANPAHELRAREIIAEEWPDPFVTLSSEIHPVIREHERFFSCVFNSYCQPSAVRLIDTLGARLHDRGFRGNLTFFSGAGGAIPTELARRLPLLMLASGPAGGVTGAVELARRMGWPDILVGDMGGTSFDTSLIKGLQPTITPRIEVAGLPTGVNVVDVTSIGAGGGSVAWIDERGVPQVGPHSAGSMPGPVCYGRGGTEPTVTDAAVAAGLIDPAGYLGGRVTLDRAAAERTIEGFGRKFGWSLAEAIDAILELTVINMATALRAVTVERGEDPRRLTMIAYGGTLPLFAASICRRLEIERLVVPANSSVFSAFGVLAAEFVRRHTLSLELMLTDPGTAGRVEEARERMRTAALAEAAAGGIDPAACQLRWGADLRFRGQVFEISVELGSQPLQPDGAERLAASFPAHYERTYGPATAWQGSPVVLVNLTLTLTAGRPSPPLAVMTEGPRAAHGAEMSRRTVLLPGGERRPDVPVYDGRRFAAGMAVEGPAVVDEHDTTIFVVPQWTCQRDRHLNCILEAHP